MTQFNNIIKACLITLLALFSLNSGFTQSINNNGEYFSNKAVLNPAYTGINGGYNASMLYKKMWTGFDNSPQYMRIHYDMALPDYNSGLGMSVNNYKVGAFSDINIAANYSYTLNINDEQSVYLGLGLNYLHSAINLSNGTAADRNDIILTKSNYNESLNGVNSSFGAGYRYLNLYVGLGINNLFTPTRGFGTYTYPVYREFKMFVNYKFDIDKIWAIESTIIPAYVSERGLALELAAIGRYDKGLWFGLNVIRPLNYGIILGMNIDEHFYFNYNAAIVSQPSLANTMGNHEICIGYYFNNVSKERKQGFNVINKVAKLFGKKQRF